MPKNTTPHATPVATFIDFMTLFGTVQQQLKNRMQDESDEKLGPLHMRLLCLCAAEPGCTQQQVVRSMGRDKGQIARLARDLEERKLIERSADAQDRRIVRLVLTAEGDTRRRWFERIEATLANDMFGQLAGPERDYLHQLFQQVKARVVVDE
jgi:DNA-binding MarR family transcriptional regulator